MCPDGESDEALWQGLVDAEHAYVSYRMALLARCADLLGVIRRALHIPHHRGTALRLLPFTNPTLRCELFGDLVALASVGHSDVQLCRDAIRSLPRSWVVDHLEAAFEPILAEGGEEEYRRLLELSDTLDAGVTERLATRAAASPDLGIREAGLEFQQPRATRP